MASPVRRGMRRTKPRERRRDRVLSDQEIKALWPICEESGPFGGIVQILLLSAQRLEKVQQMRWQDIDTTGVWHIPQAHKREKSNAKVLPWFKLLMGSLETTSGRAICVDCRPTAFGPSVSSQRPPLFVSNFFAC